MVWLEYQGIVFIVVVLIEMVEEATFLVCITDKLKIRVIGDRLLISDSTALRALTRHKPTTFP